MDYYRGLNANFETYYQLFELQTSNFKLEKLNAFFAKFSKIKEASKNETSKT